ncbi:hypothetical protein BDB00DRAFT_759214, partial [Zychaea mexicana]|uniref:uncharacterized protein n=1 Tax=Zychaea mexicana TaxID=64656 RepID=UPI0022FEBD46
HICKFYPRYHFETNWIEHYFEGAKAIARREYDHSFASLRSNLPGFLDSNSIDQLSKKMEPFRSQLPSRSTGSTSAVRIILKPTAK